MRAKNTSGCFVLLLMAAIFAPSAQAGSPRCFMHGVIMPTAGEKAALSDLIRLHFDAEEKKKCEVMMAAYCQYNIREKDYSPERIKGSFKADTEKLEEFTYTFSPKCKIVPDKDEDN